jgi:hypothetical protein
MATDKPQPTLADYVTIVLSPALIMAMIVSLVFFLLTVLYHGEFVTRLHYILFFFIFGMVLVARISMEGGVSARAPLYGGVLAILVWFGMGSFVSYPPELAASSWLINAGLIALAWWLSYQLTYSCTYIDEKAENTGTGVLQAAGLAEAPASDPHPQPLSQGEREDEPQSLSQGERGHDKAPASDPHPQPLSQGETEDARPDSLGERGDKKLTWWERYQRFRAERKKTQPPGVWVVYFALAALPIFGLGQALIDVADVERRTYTFWLMTLYVASSLGLLVTTAFLGLRRYLRQRRLEMPKTVTAAWLVLGAVLLAALLVFAAILPRPQAEFSALTLSRAGSKEVAASKNAITQDDPGKGEGRPGRQEHDPKGDPVKDKNVQGKDSKGETKGADFKGTKKNGADDSGKKPGESRDTKGAKKEAANDPGKKDGDSRDNKGAQKDPANDPGKKAGDKGAPPDQKQEAADKSGGNSWLNFLSKAATVLKWIIFGLLALATVVFVLRGGLRYLANFTEWARRLLEALRSFWDRLFGGRQCLPASNGDVGEISPAKRAPFQDFANPFLNGRAEKMTAADLVRYSFEALEAWAAERECGRGPHETPMEFTNRLADEAPALDKETQRLGSLYARVLYARGGLPSDWRRALEEFWQQLDAVPAPQPVHSI